MICRQCKCRQAPMGNLRCDPCVFRRGCDRVFRWFLALCCGVLAVVVLRSYV